MKKKTKRKTSKDRLLRIFAIICIAVFVFCGCSSEAETDGTKTKELPQIVIGCDDYSPYNYIGTDGRPTGIDVALATEAFKRMGYQVKFSFIDWERKKTLLEKGEIDCIWCCFSMDGRETEYRWAGPYMRSFQAVAVSADSDIKSLQDLAGKKVAVQSTTKPEEILLHAEEYHLPELEALFCMQNRELIYSFLSKGHADAIAAHESSIIQYINDYGVEEQYRILEEPLLTVGLGVAFAPDDDRGIAEELKKTLKEMYDEGKTEEILTPYLKTPKKYLEVYEDEN